MIRELNISLILAQRVFDLCEESGATWAEKDSALHMAKIMLLDSAMSPNTTDSADSSHDAPSDLEH